MKTKKSIPLFFFLLLIIYFSFMILTVNAPITMTVSQDSWVTPDAPDNNYGNDTTAFLGWDAGVTDFRQALFGFDDDDIEFWVNEYNEGNVPIAVYIRIWARTYMAETDFQIKSYRIDEVWYESNVTYNNRPNLAEELPTQQMSISDGLTWQYYYLNITDDFIEVLSGDYADFEGYWFYGLQNWTHPTHNVWFEFSTTESAQPEAKIYYGYPIPEYEEYEETFFQTQAGANFIVLFFFIFIPPLILAFEFSQHNASPSLGFVGGLILTVSIGYMTGLMPLWFVFCCVLIIILFLFMTLKGKGWL